jgi:drug/metabolite transporter (DMT)-like permease
MKSYGLLAVVCAVFGTTFLAIKLGVDAGAPPFLFAGIRFVVAGSVLGGALLATRRATFRSLAKLAPRAALLSLVYIVFNYGCTFWAEQFIPSSEAAQIDALGPIASAALSALFLGKRLKLAHGLGIAAGFAGVWLVVRGAAAPIAAAPIDGASSVIAPIVMICAAVGFAGAGVLYKRLFDDDTDPLAVSSLNMLSGGVALAVLAALVERKPFPMSADALLPLAYLVVVGSLVAHSAYLTCIKRAGPLFASSWSYVSPVIATAMGAVALGEGVSPWSLAGAALTLLGVYAISRVETKRTVLIPRAPSAEAGQ